LTIHPQKTELMINREYDIEPFSFVRKAQGGKWTPADIRYKANKEHLKLLRPEYQEGWGFTFIMTMPATWSKKKRASMDGTKVRRKQWRDIDNLLKPFLDCLDYDDGIIAETGPMRKIWGERGKIIVHQRVADYF